MRFKSGIGKRHIVYSWSNASKKISSLSDIADYVKLKSPMGHDIYVDRKDPGIMVSEGCRTIVSSISDTVEGSDEKIDRILEELEAKEMEIPPSIKKMLEAAITEANKFPDPEEFIKNMV